MKNKVTCSDIYENEFGFAVEEDVGDDTRVKARVDVVKDSAGEGDGEMEFIHGGDVGSDDGDDVATVDT